MIWAIPALNSVRRWRGESDRTSCTTSPKSHGRGRPELEFVALAKTRSTSSLTCHGTRCAPSHRVPKSGRIAISKATSRTFLRRSTAAKVRGLAIRNRADYEAYIAWDWDTGVELERGHYTGCIYDCRGEYSPAAWIEKIAASQVAERYPHR